MNWTGGSALDWPKLYDALDSDSSSWSCETRKRYKCSLRQIPRTIDEYCTDIGSDIEDLMAVEVTTAVVSEFVERRRASGVTVSTINRDLTAFSNLMKSIKNDSWIETNPVQNYDKQGMKEVLPDIYRSAFGSQHP